MSRLLKLNKYDHRNERSKLADKHAEDLILVHAAFSYYMQEVGNNTVVEEVIRKADPNGTGLLVEHAPLDAHEARQNDVSDAHDRKRTRAHLAVSDASEGRYEVPKAKQECREEESSLRPDFLFKESNVKTSEESLFHPYVYDVESDAHQNEADSRLLGDVARKRESRHKELHVARVTGSCKRNEFNCEADRIKDRADKETLEAVRQEPGALKADVTPLLLQHAEQSKQHNDTEDLVDEALGEDRLVGPDEENLCRVNDEADDEYDDRVPYPVFF